MRQHLLREVSIARLHNDDRNARAGDDIDNLPASAQVDAGVPPVSAAPAVAIGGGRDLIASGLRFYEDAAPVLQAIGRESARMPFNPSPNRAMCSRWRSNSPYGR